MPAKTLSKGSNSKTATLSPAGSVALEDGALTLSISMDTASFVASENIKKIEFWNDVSGLKGDILKGTWYRNSSDGTSNQPADIGIGNDSAGTGVIITDDNTSVDAGEYYYYKVFTSDNRSADPELVLKKRAPGS